MINATDRPLVVAQGVALHECVQGAIAAAINLIEQQLGSASSLSDVRTFAFYRLFGRHNQAKSIRFDDRFVQTCFDAAIGDSQNVGNREARRLLSDYLIDSGVPADGLQSLRRGLKLMLVELWRKKAVLLATTFAPGPHFPVGLFRHTLLDWLNSFDPSSRAQDSGAADMRRLYYYGPRLLWTTDWDGPQDVSLKDLATLQRASRLYQGQKSSVVIAGGSQLPFTILAHQALKHFGDEVRYTQDDLAKYSRWLMSGSCTEVTLEEYKKQASSQRTPGASRPRKERKVQPLEALSAGCEHDGVRRNFAALQRGHRRRADWTEHDRLVYADREHVDLAAVTPLWVEAMRAFMNNRIHIKGHRSEGETRSVLNLLADYLFFYLPWWLELARAPKVKIPASPKEFSRFCFVTRHTKESLDEFPDTLLTVIGWRRESKASQATAVHQLHLFFSFVETQFVDDARIAGPGFRSPVNADFDAPRIKTGHKTNKEVIPKGAYSYLLFYCYAVEEAGMQLERLAYTGELLATPKSLLGKSWLNLSELGVSGIMVKRRFEELPLHEVPNVFEWRTRKLKATQGQGSRTAFVPHCTALRLLIATLETGLRAQSVQWLDRRMWRREAGQVSSDSYTFPLYINTDKTKESPWVTYAVHRVRDLLERQESFQDLFVDADAFGAVNYEGSPNTPFAPIEPLFRSTTNGKPVADGTYAKTWQQLMVGFETFFRAATGEIQAKFFTLTATRTPNNQPAVCERSDGTLFCPLSLLAVHTPHACRATFATNRQGILSLSDAAQLLGHSSEVVTAHYTKPSWEDLSERIRKSDIAQNTDFLQFEQDSVAHIRADKADSALVRSFSRDRAATIKAYGFLPSLRLWSTEDSLAADEGLQLLREGPMSRIRFRETHVCPVGEECPSDVIELIGEPRRCGCCPLAMKCVDHAPAISAKQNQLLERIRYLHGRYKTLEAQGEPVAVLDEIWDELELDANEYLGWQLSEELLAKLPRETAEGSNLEMLVQEPEIVKRHLLRVSRNTDTAGLMLQRIADSNAYPSMATPAVQMAASQIKRRLLAGKDLGALDWNDDISSSVADAAKLLAVMMKATGMSVEDVSRSVLASQANPKAPRLTGEIHGL